MGGTVDAVAKGMEHLPDLRVLAEVPAVLGLLGATDVPEADAPRTIPGEAEAVPVHRDAAALAPPRVPEQGRDRWARARLAR